MLRCLGDILAFSGKMPERHVKISYADTTALFSERHVKMSGRHFFPQDSERHVQMFGGHLGLFSGKMSVRNVKILPCL